jgi:hypothetical protein
MNYLITAAMLLFLAGCANKPLPTPTAKPIEKPLIIAPEEPKKSRWFGGHGWQS